MAMTNTEDSVFGTLVFRGDWTRSTTQELFGRTFDIDILVASNDSRRTIREEQRNAYLAYRDRNAEFVVGLEDCIVAYYRDHFEEFRVHFGTNADLYVPRIEEPSEMVRIVKLTGVLFPLLLRAGESRIAFLLECTWDPEDGLGVLWSNGEFCVGTQDLVT